MKIILATHNQGKIRELSTLLSSFKLDIITSQECHLEEIPETGLTFVENAIIKARHACAYTGLPALADDSGLAVSALNGAPGIYSARYAGETCSPHQNIEKLMYEMRDIPTEQRHATFHCILVFMRHAHDPSPVVCEGTWEGMILTSPKGEYGFGYDPIFYDPIHRCSAAELSPEIKNKISHRGTALQVLLEKLKFLKDF